MQIKPTTEKELLAMLEDSYEVFEIAAGLEEETIPMIGSPNPMKPLMDRAVEQMRFVLDHLEPQE